MDKRPLRLQLVVAGVRRRPPDDDLLSHLQVIRLFLIDLQSEVFTTYWPKTDHLGREVEPVAFYSFRKEKLFGVIHKLHEIRNRMDYRRGVAGPAERVRMDMVIEMTREYERKGAQLIQHINRSIDVLNDDRPESAFKLFYQLLEDLNKDLTKDLTICGHSRVMCGSLL